MARIRSRISPVRRDDELIALRSANTKLSALLEGKLRAAVPSLDTPIIFEDANGVTMGAFIPNEGLFPSPQTAASFTEYTNQMSALAGGLLAVASVAGGRWRDTYVKHQQGELAAAYIRFRTFLESIGDDPDGAPGYVDMYNKITAIEKTAHDAILTGNYGPLKHEAQTAPQIFSDALRAVASAPQRARNMSPANQWLGENAKQIRNEYLREYRKAQRYINTSEELLRRLEGVSADWRDDLVRTIKSLQGDKEGIKNYIKQNERRV